MIMGQWAWYLKRVGEWEQVITKNKQVIRLAELSIILLKQLLALKVKCNEIWTIFLFSKNLREKVSCINRKQNQLLKISFVRIVAPKTRKSDDFRELHENEPEMAALGVETKL